MILKTLQDSGSQLVGRDPFGDRVTTDPFTGVGISDIYITDIYIPAAKLVIK